MPYHYRKGHIYLWIGISFFPLFFLISCHSAGSEATGKGRTICTSRQVSQLERELDVCSALRIPAIDWQRHQISQIERALEAFPDLRIPVIDGQCHLVYQPNPNRPNTWFVNDHCLFEDAGGKIHFFGIENPYPSTAEALKQVGNRLEDSDCPFIETLRRMRYGHIYIAETQETHRRVGHAVADNILGPWKRCGAVLNGSYGSPFVVEHNGRYWMLVPSRTQMAVSDDLMHWEDFHPPTPPGLNVPYWRDPCVIRLKDGTFLQYFAGPAADPNQGQVVNVARSKDILRWERLDPCFSEKICKTSFGIFESPAVFYKDGLYYLFVGFSHRRYYETFVVVSDDPYHFKPEHTITTLLTHAPELIEIDGQTYISSCGIEDKQILNRSGLWISKLRWIKP